MSNRLAGKTALITGSGAGIGAATARLFCREGAAVILVDACAEALEKTVAAIRADTPGARMTHFAANIADADQVTRAVRHGIDAFGALDVLVNNAAMRVYASIAEATPADWQAITNVNLSGTANCCRAALPALRASGHGSIVIVSSCHAITGRKGMGLYDTTKAGLLALMRTLAFEESAHGIRANAVCPGSTFTDFHIGRAAAAGKRIETLRTERQHNSLIGRWAEPDEIAWPILWLASSEASFVTGATLMVDGGLSIM
jgi:2-hydroxycyclohexanecarboxyl-CoA dehydrogenase